MENAVQIPETELFFRMRDINKDYPLADESIRVLKNVNFDLEKGEYVSILGPSGSGKSTLMNIIGLLDEPTGGSYILNGRMVDDLNEIELARVRGQEIDHGQSK